MLAPKLLGCDEVSIAKLNGWLHHGTFAVIVPSDELDDWRPAGERTIKRPRIRPSPVVIDQPIAWPNAGVVIEIVKPWKRGGDLERRGLRTLVIGIEL